MRLAKRLPLDHRSDIDLLAAFLRATDEEGGAEAVEVARLLPEGEGVRASVSMRFAWLKRKGVMSRDDDGRWFLTDLGKDIWDGHALTAGQERQLSALAGRRGLGVVGVIGRIHNSDSERWMLRRELRYWDAQNGRRAS